MLTGEPAMNMDVPYQELVRQVSDGEPRQRAEALGTPLGILIAKMLRRREAFRYTSAREVWSDMRELPAWKQRDLFPPNSSARRDCSPKGSHSVDLVGYDARGPGPSEQASSHLGRFEVGAKIGGGGMATVYVGRDVREDGTEKLVALKVIRDELAQDEQFANMFIDEAKILSRLSHPNVIQTLEYGITGVHRFIAMELLNGRTAADIFEALVAAGDRFDLAVAAWVCARVAEGLHSAHELVDEGGAPLSVIHRDVNPSNIFLTHAGEVKLIDFGLARARVRVSKSAEGVVKGKIPYLAPEQAFGEPIDRRIDIYALGTTLWELTTMRRLFKRDNDVDTLKAIREAVIPDPREENPDFPDALWRIIERSLRRERDERYGTAEENADRPRRVCSRDRPSWAAGRGARLASLSRRGSAAGEVAA
jgi:serine/threonine protein kinase